MRLIDADALMEDIIRRFGCKPYIEVGLICEYVHDIIDAQPTVFKPNNVIEQLKEYAHSEICMENTGCPYIDSDVIKCENCGALGAIDIVRKGIKNEHDK